ncbi:uncharacterized protein LOC135103480 [Scylla paramamosain]|uniref:uncharacterized protein LOC135103480 n=1 Tax=Scylla paramamosain TaxID=85552 RepID=UPI0030839DD4
MNTYREGPMQPTQEKNMSRSAEVSTDHAQPASTWDNSRSHSGSKCTRPHSKTTVFGASLKTRLHCNHLVPKCKCSSKKNRKRTRKTKHVVQENGLQRRVTSSSCTFPRGDEDRHSPLNKIPYEPRTKFVRNLKEKLETNYMKDKSDQRRTNVDTSAALRESEGYKDPLRHEASQSHHKHHGNKCLHHYQQNERLFLEPTITNRKGQSLCVECSAPQPRDPHQEPYLYHITLGGLKTNADKRHSTASVNQFSNRGKVNNRVSNMKSKKISADMYARLNDRIDNILGRRDIHSTFSRHSAPLNSPIPSYSKRSPSRSMALMDHII